MGSDGNDQTDDNSSNISNNRTRSLRSFPWKSAMVEVILYFHFTSENNWRGKLFCYDSI